MQRKYHKVTYGHGTNRAHIIENNRYNECKQICVGRILVFSKI